MAVKSDEIDRVAHGISVCFRFVYVTGTAGLIGLSAYLVFQYARPFVIAFFLSMIMQPIVQWFVDKWHWPRGIAVLTVMVGLGGGAVGLMVWLALEMIDGIASLLRVVPGHVTALIESGQTYFFRHLFPLWERLNDIVQTMDKSQQDAVYGRLKDIGSEAAGLLNDMGIKIVGALTKWVLSFPNMLSTLAFSALATYFISKDWPALAAYVSSKTGKPFHRTAGRVYREFREAVIGYARAQTVMVALTGLTVFIGLSLLGVNDAFTIALITATADLMPYIGTGIIFIPWAIYAWLSGLAFLAAGLGLIYLATILQRQFIEPKLLSSSIGLSPLATLVAIFAGFRLGGFAGMIAGPFAMVILHSLLRARVFHQLWAYILFGADKENR